MYRQIIIFLFLGVSIQTLAQRNETGVSIDYALAPLSEDGIDFSKTSVKFLSPIKLKKGILVNSFGVDYYKLSYDNSFGLDISELENIYQFSYNIRYVYPLVNRWALTGQIGTSLSSNLTSAISSKDLNFRWGINALKRGGSLGKPSMLMFGLNYSAITGKPGILPTISYIKQLSEKFSFGIGFPHTYVKYNFNQKHSLKSLIWMNGFYANLGSPIAVDTGDDAEKASYRAISLGAEYNCSITNPLTLVLKAGYSLNNSYELLDSENNTVYDFNSSSEPYFSVGLKFKLKGNKRKKPKQ